MSKKKQKVEKGLIKEVFTVNGIDWVKIDCPVCDIEKIYKKVGIDVRFRNSPNPNYRVCCSRKCGYLLKDSQKEVVCSNPDCCKPFKMQPARVREKNYCSRKCWKTGKKAKKKLKLCGVTGCCNPATHFIKSGYNKKGKQIIARFCDSHYNVKIQKSSEYNRAILDKANQESREITDALISPIKGIVDGGLVCEKSFRQAMHIIMFMAGLNLDGKPKNERNFRLDPTLNKDGVDIDMVIDEIELIVEWKSHWASCRKHVPEILEQNKIQKEVIQTSDMAHYRHIVCSIDGSVGNFNPEEFLKLVLDRIIDFKSKGKLRKLNLDNAKKVINKFIKSLRPVKHLFKPTELSLI